MSLLIYIFKFKKVNQSHLKSFLQWILWLDNLMDWRKQGKIYKRNLVKSFKRSETLPKGWKPKRLQRRLQKHLEKRQIRHHERRQSRHKNTNCLCQLIRGGDFINLTNNILFIFQLIFYELIHKLNLFNVVFFTFWI